MLYRVTAISALLAVSALCQAQDSAPAAAEKPAFGESSQEDPNRIVCTLERPTGSNIPRRVCMTAAQRDALRQNTQQTLRDAHLRTPTSGQ